MADNTKRAEPSFKIPENLLKTLNESYEFFRNELQELSQKANEVSDQVTI